MNLHRGHDTEESDQEETSQDGEGKARRQGRQEEGLTPPAPAVLTEATPTAPIDVYRSQLRMLMGALWGLNAPSP